MHTFDEIANQLDKFLHIGIALSAEKDHNKLLEMIINEARRITNADAGTLYLKEGNHLRMKIIQNQSMNTFLGGKGEDVNLPPVPISPQYVSGFTAITGKSVNIPDVYQDSDFDFSGPREYDKVTGYRTVSMLVIPLKNHLDEIIGVLQLINALDRDRDQQNIIPFDIKYQEIMEAISSLAAISMTKMQLIREIEELFESFVKVMVTAIEAQTPYNATHTQKVSQLAKYIAQEISRSREEPFAGEYFDQDRTDQLVMAGWMHDIGKVATPLAVMNKPTRLDQSFPLVTRRIEYVIEQKKCQLLYLKLALYEEKERGKAREKGKGEYPTPGKAMRAEMELEDTIDRLTWGKELVTRANDPSMFIDPEMKKQLEEFGQITYLDESGQVQTILTPEELVCLTTAKGTLTENERKIMENHVELTRKLLDQIPFPKKLKQVPKFACMHHESLNGRGYPQGLKGEEIPLEARILAIADVYDALTASDRPYKKGMPPEKALEIMQFMVKDGSLDPDIMALFREKETWKMMDLQPGEEAENPMIQ